MKPILKYVGSCIALCSFAFACNDNSYVPVSEDYKAYLQNGTTDSVVCTPDKFAAYFDFSGVYIAYEDSATNLTFNGLTQKITGSLNKYDIYSLANDSVMPLSNVGLSSGQLFAKLKDSNQHGQLYAPIEKSLKKIIDEDRSALLVTDFEEYTKEKMIYRQAYATQYFEEWLKRGKTITFFVTDYREIAKKNKAKKKNEKLQGNLKHLYYTVFDDNNETLLKEVMAGLEGCPKNYKVFRLSNSNYTVYTKYDGINKGGTYHNEDGDDIVTASIEDATVDGHFFKIDGLNAEVYTFTQTWPNIIANAKALSEPGVTTPFQHILKGLYVDFSQFDSYIIKSCEVNVSEIEDDFNRFVGRRLAAQYPVQVSVIEGETVVEVPKESQSYYDANGKLLDYYQQDGNTYKVSDLLKISQSLFDETYSNEHGKTTEIGIDLCEKATGVESVSGNMGSLLRVDVSISEAVPNIGQPQKGEQLYDLFYWEGNDCLYMAVKNVLQHANPQGKVLYTYLIHQQK